MSCEHHRWPWSSNSVCLMVVAHQHYARQTRFSVARWFFLINSSSFMNTSCIWPWPDGWSCLSFPLPRSVYQPEAVTANRQKFVLSPSSLLGLSCNSPWPSGFDSVSWRPTAVKQQQARLFYQFFFLIFCTLLHWKKVYSKPLGRVSECGSNWRPAGLPWCQTSAIGRNSRF